MKQLPYILIPFILFAFFLYTFLYIGFFCYSDIPAHAAIAIQNMQTGHMFNGNFLLYFLMNLFSGFSIDLEKVIIANCILLSIAVVMKYQIVFDCFHQKYSFLMAAISSFSLLLVYIIPLVVPVEYLLGYKSVGLYLHYFVPNVWHNSTIIFSMPFAIWTYILAIQLLKKQTLGVDNFSFEKCCKMSIVMLISVMIKPSFCFAFIIPYTLIGFYQYRKNMQKLAFMLLPVIIGLVGVAYQFLTIYDGHDGSHVIFTLNNLISIEHWKLHLPFYISSLILPVTYFVLNFKKCIQDMEFYLVYSMLAISILIFLLFEETGPRAGHGNFSWQIIVSMWFVYYYIVRNELSSIKKINIHNYIQLPQKHKIIVSLYSTMFFFGIIYLSYIFLFKTYI